MFLISLSVFMFLFPFLPICLNNLSPTKTHNLKVFRVLSESNSLIVYFKKLKNLFFQIFPFVCSSEQLEFPLLVKIFTR